MTSQLPMLPYHRITATAMPSSFAHTRFPARSGPTATQPSRCHSTLFQLNAHRRAVTSTSHAAPKIQKIVLFYQDVHLRTNEPLLSQACHSSPSTSLVVKPLRQCLAVLRP